MADIWQNFEVECFTYLKENYPKANFYAFGQSDSTKPDIYVVPSHGKAFYIETKSNKAQCGQFVLIPNEEEQQFYYSPKNHTSFFASTQTIMNYMNSHFSTFIKAGTSGEKINLNKSLFYDWITNYYSEKGVKYFITKSSDYLIFPIDRFSEYFDVSCCYRMKRSGSSAPGESNIAEITDILSKNSIQGELKFVEKELHLTTQKIIKDNKISGDKYTYMFRAYSNSDYLIRKLSNTCNSNVIFHISLKKYNQDKADLLNFTNTL